MCRSQTEQNLIPNQTLMSLWSINRRLVACDPDVTGWVYLLVKEIRICVMRILIREAAWLHTKVCFALPASSPPTDCSLVAYMVL